MESRRKRRRRKKKEKEEEEEKKKKKKKKKKEEEEEEEEEEGERRRRRRRRRTTTTTTTTRKHPCENTRMQTMCTHRHIAGNCSGSPCPVSADRNWQVPLLSAGESQSHSCTVCKAVVTTFFQIINVIIISTDIV